MKFSTSPNSPASIWLSLARVFQLAIICLTAGLFILSVPLSYEQRRVVCASEDCPSYVQLTPGGAQALEAVGVSADEYAGITLVLDILIAVVYAASGLLILIRKPNDLFAIFVTIMLVTFGLATLSEAMEGLKAGYPAWSWLIQTIELLGDCAVIAFFFVFPTGHFVPRWSALIVPGWAILHLPRYYFPDSSFNLLDSHPLLYHALFLGGILSGILAQVFRYRRVSGSIERLQTKWVVLGISMGLGGYIVVSILSLLLADPAGRDQPAYLGLNVLLVLFMLFLPVSISIAVLRYRLWDINPIINRTLVYAALSFLTIAFYVLIVGGFALYFRSNETNLVISFIATGIVAMLFEPLRQRLQRAVNRLMYGERDDPATVILRLSQRLDTALAPDSVLQTIVETLAQTLRLPYAAIALLNEEPRFSSTRQVPPSDSISLPLTYQTERVGQLILAPRAHDESFSPADMKLINIIAQQAGTAAYNLRLTKDLQRSREKLVTAQEEERRRLRRDLHDGVGPTLASLSQRLDAAADLVQRNPEESVQLLKELKSQVRGTVAEIRRLVYALRPSVLDEFGLATAIREHVAPYTGPKGIQLTFEVPELIPSLPAAVEVAAYRIALEAFANIVQHAEASRCDIKIKLENHWLLLEVSDNGRGLTSKPRTGVGLSSMHERAAELGGECIVESVPSGGTRVTAHLPISPVYKE